MIKASLLKLISEIILNLLLRHFDYLKSNYKLIDSFVLAKLLCRNVRNYSHEIADLLQQQLDFTEKISQAENFLFFQQVKPGELLNYGAGTVTSDETNRGYDSITHCSCNIF